MTHTDAYRERTSSGRLGYVMNSNHCGSLSKEKKKEKRNSDGNRIIPSVISPPQPCCKPLLGCSVYFGMDFFTARIKYELMRTMSLKEAVWPLCVPLSFCLTLRHLP